MSLANLSAAYNATREPGTDQSVLCHAPFISLNFDQSGRATACCFNRHFVLGRYPEQTVREIWNGAPAQELREAFRTGAHAPGCDCCFSQLSHRNFSGALMRNFDPYTAQGAVRRPNSDGLPLLIEFEISNTCNLECVMCAGNWSSAIRARREKLPPLPDPYDRRFVDQIEEFVPTLAAAKFLGGEPFIINRYHEIWDSFRRLNPNALLSITTSGATLPNRSRTMLEHLRADIVVSLDGITKPTYESIRVNARFDDVMENIKYFRDYTRRRGTSLTAAVCPMTHNWRELHDIVNFCEEREIFVYFNTVTHPIGSTLAGLSASELAEVVERLDAEGRAAASRWSPGSRRNWQGMTDQLRSWLAEGQTSSDESRDAAAAARRFVAVHLGDEANRALLQRVEPMVLPLMVAIESAAPQGLSHQYPLALWSADQSPEPQELLLSAHLVRRFADAREAGRAGEDETHVLIEHQRLRRYLAWLFESPEHHAVPERIAADMRARLRYRTSQTAFDIVDNLLLDAERVLSGGEPDRLRHELEVQCDRLDAEGVDEQALVRGYVRHLFAFHVRPRYLRGDKPGPGPGAESEGRIADVRAARAFFHAALMFHPHVSPAATHDSFRRRVDAVREALARNPQDALLAGLQKAHVAHIYAFWATASDEEFAGAAAVLS